ncbi:uncharacterized protein KQ657_000801 [Scheffersomyces spartinae]|uniref:Uncharacterized protein n=1 Tax=Scheffersomyces spartinae TaxID=45513 RepID=A0A9P7V8R5_9ASCO|nr:uncharacterized protein KQ657_000801 [Scheffersomyces spartinae]KAG7193383.1 hypothetical protein KQ657_000801 [Scheffersomyces spartinae]
MLFQKIALPLALLATGALAATGNNSTLTTATPTAVSKGCSFSDFTATVPSQVQEVAACPTAVGNIVILGSDLGSSVDLTGVKQIFGDLSIKNATRIISFVAPDLELISGNFEIISATVLETINLAQLTTVGTLLWNHLNAINSTGLTSGLTTADSVTISDTTLAALEGINVFQLKTFDINNNGNIQLIDSGLKSVTDLLSVSFNSESVDVKLDYLTSAKNVVFQSVNSISAANLTSVNGSLTISSSNLKELSLDKLTNVGAALTIDDNTKLTDVSFASLKNIAGAFEIADNTNLGDFGDFEKLATVGGSVNFTGTFDNGTLPALTRVSGGFSLDSDGDLPCKEFNKLNSDGVVKGDKYFCAGKSESTSSSSAKSGSGSATADSSSSGSGSASSSSTSSKKSSGSSNNAGLTGLFMSMIMMCFGVALI